MTAYGRVGTPLLSFQRFCQIPDQGFRQRKEGAALRQSVRNFILFPLHAERGDLKLLLRQYRLIKLVYTHLMILSLTQEAPMYPGHQRISLSGSVWGGGGTYSPSLISIKNLHSISHLSWGGEC